MLPTIGSSNFFSSLLSVRIPSRPFISIAVFLSIPHSYHLLLAQSRNYAPALRAVESTAPCRAGAKHDPESPSRQPCPCTTGESSTMDLTLKTTGSAPTSSTGLFSPTSTPIANRQSTPLTDDTPQSSPYLHPLQLRKVRE